jgi:hypothetical protein
MEKKSVISVYKEICTRYCQLERGSKRTNEELVLAWVMSLLEQTEEVNPTK